MRRAFFGAILILLLAALPSFAQPAAQSLMDIKPEPLTPLATPALSHSEAMGEPEEARPSARFWFQGDYLLWWIKDSHIPPLVTTGPPSASLPGALGMPGTQTLFGGGNVDNSSRSGGRFTAGWWFDEAESLGLEGSYLFLGSHAVGADFRSSGLPGSPILGRPFFDVVRNAQDVGLVAFPGLASGEVAVSSSSRLQGAELNVLAHLGGDSGLCFDALAGVRYLQLDENIDIFDSQTIAANTLVLGGDKIATADFFGTQNRFYGGQLGVRGRWRYDRFSLDFLGKVALGEMNESVRIHGSTSVTPSGGPTTTFPAGFLALATNSGRFTKDDFTVVPEVGLTGGYWITDHFRLTVGYSLLYLADVARPGDQIDLGLNPTQIPLSLSSGPLTGPPRPAAAVHQTQFWAQGLSFGVEFQY